MEPEIASIIKVGMISGTILVGLVAQAFVGRRRKSKTPPPVELNLISARLDRIEIAIDSIAIEMERVSEAQRFTAKILAERPAEAVPARTPGRVITPH